MKLKTFVLAFTAFSLLFSCKKEDKSPINNNVFKVSFNIDNDSISFDNTKDNIERSRFFGGNVEGFTILIGHFETDKIHLTNTIQIDIANKDYGTLEDKNQLENILSKRKIEFLDCNNLYNTTKEGVLITYYEMNDTKWTSGDFHNKFYGLNLDSIVLNYSNYTFEIIDAETVEGTYEGCFARKLKINIDCDLMNAKGEIKRLKMTNASFIYEQ